MGLQSKLFPKYFQFSVLTIGICIALMYNEEKDKVITQKQYYNLCVIMVIFLINLFFIEPKTTAIMFERHVIERKLGTGHEIGQIKPSDPKAAQDPELRVISKKFGMFHGISSSLNLIALYLATWHMIYMGSKFQI